jgi:hypothetical protein
MGGYWQRHARFERIASGGIAARKEPPVRNWLTTIGRVAARRGVNRTGIELSEEDEQASTEPRPRARILHLSDLHLGANLAKSSNRG